jgi:hypothetical protein
MVTKSLIGHIVASMGLRLAKTGKGPLTGNNSFVQLLPVCGIRYSPGSPNSCDSVFISRQFASSYRLINFSKVTSTSALLVSHELCSARCQRGNVSRKDVQLG